MKILIFLNQLYIHAAMKKLSEFIEIDKIPNKTSDEENQHAILKTRIEMEMDPHREKSF